MPLTYLNIIYREVPNAYIFLVKCMLSKTKTFKLKRFRNFVVNFVNPNHKIEKTCLPETQKYSYMYDVRSVFYLLNCNSAMSLLFQKTVE